ncbi:hypothetical protein OSH11_02075 [Kaistia dalseonensis]|uniref:Lipoprotein n=1 Tax=Kaistia dalseonensis TaxID=410840 RepID=A0ABU0H156_9HYPH|nr:hypothetical protein [Kaistia dalseonensis]MCX5493483.1 hypothetical protein [Kaistia dalseonensis]MDQ0436043.1 hypothetical protein [Kaistia dalseonensis]
MRSFIILLAMAGSLTGLSSLAGCTTNPNDPAIQAMNNPPNSCGPGGTANINDCSSSNR